jgi:hypothetical protein
MEDDYIPFIQASKLFDSALDPKFMLKTTGFHWDTFDGQKAVLSPLMGILSFNTIAFKKGLRTDWGFACLVEGVDQSICFHEGHKL